MKTIRIGLIGHLATGQAKYDGQTVSTRMWEKELKKLQHMKEPAFVDTFDYKHKLFSLVVNWMRYIKMKKKWIIPVVIVGVIIILWFTGIIPKQIAKVSGTNYVNEHFPKMQLGYVGVEWADVYGDYLITFKGPDENTYSCVIGPKYFPVSMGQGLFAIESDYAENYK